MPIPVQNTNQCWLRVKFPADIELPDPDLDAKLTYQTTAGNMMARSFETGSLEVNKGEVQERYQQYKSGIDESNIIIFRGCTTISGAALVPFLKISGITTPFAVKDTAKFEIDLYKDFDEVSYDLSNHILTGSGIIDASKF